MRQVATPRRTPSNVVICIDARPRQRIGDAARVHALVKEERADPRTGQEIRVSPVVVVLLLGWRAVLVLLDEQIGSFETPPPALDVLDVQLSRIPVG